MGRAFTAVALLVMLPTSASAADKTATHMRCIEAAAKAHPMPADYTPGSSEAVIDAWRVSYRAWRERQSEASAKCFTAEEVVELARILAVQGTGAAKQCGLRTTKTFSTLINSFGSPHDEAFFAAEKKLRYEYRDKAPNLAELCPRLREAYAKGGQLWPGLVEPLGIND